MRSGRILIFLSGAAAVAAVCGIVFLIAGLIAGMMIL